MSDALSRPTFGSATMPFPDEATIEPVWLYGDTLTLGGKTRRDVMARKYKYTMVWKYLAVSDYDALETQVNLLEAATFTYAKWPQSVSGVLCLGNLSARRLEYGAGNTSYLSSVTLTLTEVNSRI
jgi:hypothetical protein